MFWSKSPTTTHAGSVWRVRATLARGGPDIELQQHAQVVGRRRRLQERHQRPQSTAPNAKENYESWTTSVFGRLTVKKWGWSVEVWGGIRCKRYCLQRRFQERNFCHSKMKIFLETSSCASNRTNQIVSFDQPMKLDQSDWFFDQVTFWVTHCLLYKWYLLCLGKILRNLRDYEIYGQTGPLWINWYGNSSIAELIKKPTDVNSGCRVSIQLHFWCFTYFY